MDYAQGISQFVSMLASKAIPLLTAIAAVGTLSMAIIQTVKDLTPLRKAFQRRYLRRWLRQKCGYVSGTMRGQSVSPNQAEKELIQLATAGDAAAFYDLPIEQLCGQANAATQVVLEFPHRYPDLLLALGAQSDPEDLQLLLASNATGERSAAQIEARARTTHFVQRSIDSLQIAVGYRWKLYMQAASFLLSYLITVIGVAVYSHTGNTGGGRHVFSLLVVGLAAGFLAPIARDLISALQRIRS